MYPNHFKALAAELRRMRHPELAEDLAKARKEWVSRNEDLLFELRHPSLKHELERRRSDFEQRRENKIMPLALSNRKCASRWRSRNRKSSIHSDLRPDLVSKMMADVRAKYRSEKESPRLVNIHVDTADGKPRANLRFNLDSLNLPKTAPSSSVEETSQEEISADDDVQSELAIWRRLAKAGEVSRSGFDDIEDAISSDDEEQFEEVRGS